MFYNFIYKKFNHTYKIVNKKLIKNKTQQISFSRHFILFLLLTIIFSLTKYKKKVRNKNKNENQVTMLVFLYSQFLHAGKHWDLYRIVAKNKKKNIKNQQLRKKNKNVFTAKK